MDISISKKNLIKAVDSEVVPVEEYQDKYYFSKKLKSIFPELTNEQIINAINFANKKVKLSGSRKKYVNALSFRMFLF
jgi:hypothetical protein